jgi:hypothetical protein
MCEKLNFPEEIKVLSSLNFRFEGINLGHGLENFSYDFELAGDNLNYINRMIYIFLSKNERKDQSCRTIVIS